MALGASRGAVVGMIMRSAAMLVAIGLVIGGVAAWSLGGTAKAFLFRIDVTDPRVYAAAHRRARRGRAGRERDPGATGGQCRSVGGASSGIERINLEL